MSCRILKVAEWGAPHVIAEVARVVKGGGLVVIPTDTVYGVAADAAQPEAVARLYAAKVREAGKPIPLLAADRHAIEVFGAKLSDAEQRLADQFWPGALTLVLNVAERTEGVRVPDCELTRDILKATGGVLRVTSANHSGDPPALTAHEAFEALGDVVELIVDAGRSSGGVASSVVRVLHGGVEVLREGAVAAQALRAAWAAQDKTERSEG